MERLILQRRVALADRLRVVRGTVAAEVTGEFLARHPDWLERYGERARVRGIEDAGFHLDFLAGAVEADSVAAFRDYARWTAATLQARDIGAAFLVENLRQVESALQRLVHPQEHALLAKLLQAGCEAALEPADAPTAASGDLDVARSVYLQALLQGARKAALNVAIEALDQGVGALELYTGVLQEAMVEVGRLWQANRITVAEEHTATAITQFVLAHVCERLPAPLARRGRAVVTGVSGELHQVGGQMLADALDGDGWNVRFLGTNLPDAGIVQVVEQHGADVVGITATMLFNVSRVRELVAQLRRAVPGVRIVLGGAAFRSAPGLWSELGADGCAGDLHSGLAVFRGFQDAAARA